MSTSAFLLLLLLLSYLLLLCGVEGAIRIGAVINPDSRIRREQKIAIDIAAQDFNTSVLPLFLEITDSGIHVLQSFIEDWRADVIIATGMWPEVWQIAETSIRARVPVVSLAATQPLTLAPNPYLLEMSSSSLPASGYAQCLADLVKWYEWRRAIVIYEDDHYGSISGSVVPRLSYALKSIGGAEIETDIVAFPPLSSVSDPRGLVQQKLESASRSLCKVYILLHWSSPSLAGCLFQTAKDLGMMGKGHVWIAGSDITALLDSTFTQSFVSSFMQGVIGVGNYVNESEKSYRGFRSRFARKFKSEYRKEGETNFNPGIHALRAYDAVRVVVQGAGEVIDKEGIDLSRAIQSTKLFGLSGGQVRPGKEAFRVVNVVGKRYREMGVWVEGFGFYKDESDVARGVVADSLGPVYWPGGMERVPGGWGKLRVGIPGGSDFERLVKVVYDDEGKVKNATGFCVEVFVTAHERLKYDLLYEFVPGIDNNGSNYDDLVAGVPERYDAAVGDITIRAKRLANVSFTEPFHPSDLVMLVRLKNKHLPWIITKPFTSEVWLMVAATFTYLSMAFWYLEHGENPEFVGPWWTQLGATLWLTFSSIFFAHGRIYSYYTKAVMVVWLLTVLILINSYTATLSSILTTEKLDPLVSDNKVGYIGDPFVLKFLEEVLGLKEHKIKNVPRMDSSLDSGEVSAVFSESPYVQMFLSKYKGYTTYGEIHRLGGFGFVFPKGSPIALDFSKAILELAEDRTLKRLEDKWFSCSLTTCGDMSTGSLRVDSFWVLFLFTGATTTVVMLLFKFRSLPSHWRHKLAEVRDRLRKKCVELWRSKLLERRSVQPSRVLSMTSSQVAPEQFHGSPNAQS